MPAVPPLSAASHARSHPRSRQHRRSSRSLPHPDSRPGVGRRVVVPVYNEQSRAGAQHPSPPRLPERDVPLQLADRHRRQREHRRHACIAAALADELAARHAPAAGPQGPRPRAARGVVAQRRARRLLHGRRPVDRPARAAAAGRAAAVRPQRRRDRLAPGARRARRARPQARADLARVQHHLARDAARALHRCPMRLQGGHPRRSRATASADPRRRLVLRHRAARARPARAACGSTRCRSTGSTTPTRAWTSCARRSTDLKGVARLASRRRWRASPPSASSRPSPTPCSSSLLREAGSAPALANARGTRPHRRRPTRPPTGASPSASWAGTVCCATTPPARRSSRSRSALTAGALGVLHGLGAGASRAVELAVLVAASLVATVTRYVALKTLVFAGAKQPANGDTGVTLARALADPPGARPGRHEGPVPVPCRPDRRPVS